MVRRRAEAPPVRIAKIAKASQHLVLEQGACDHFVRQRQHPSDASEAGGQIFGSVTDECVRVVVATGPYVGDVRSRYSYRSDPRSAQREISRQAALGLLYLGEWHTHPEAYPQPSSHDREAAKTLFHRSRLNTNALLSIIVGQGSGSESIAVFRNDGVSLRRLSWSSSVDLEAVPAGV
ncbi:MAG: Mov34/MPN/PAD-1 family protein [Acidobacteriota bacterium]